MSPKSLSLRFCAPLILLAALSPVSSAAVYRVSSFAGGPSADGKSWATAFDTVQAAVNAASAGDEVWVSSGTYFECITLKDGVSLYGGFAGTETDRSQRDWKANETILDGNQKGTVLTGVLQQPYFQTATEIDGLTIQNGRSVHNGPSDTVSGTGGIAAYGPLTLRHCTVTGNYGDVNGGADLNGAVVEDNVFRRNTAYGMMARPTGGAGTFVDCVIQRNLVTGNQVGMQSSAIRASGSTVRYNTMTSNTGGRGGGLQAVACVVEANTIADNTADGGGGIDVCSCTVRSNVIARNVAFLGGGMAIYDEGGSNVITNNTIITVPGVGEAIYLRWSGTTLANNIIIGDTGGRPVIWAYKGTEGVLPVLRNNLVQVSPASTDYAAGDVPPHYGDVSGTLVFANAKADDYHLAITSAGIDAGWDVPLTADALDRDGKPRRQGAHSDLGAYEFPAPADPVISPSSGAYLPPKDIAISDTTADATIHYTMNGAEPTESDPVVGPEGKITLTAFALVKARAFKTGMVPSATVTAGFQIGQLWFDTARALRIAGGFASANESDFPGLDAAPHGVSAGRIDVYDAIALARRAAGLDH